MKMKPKINAVNGTRKLDAILALPVFGKHKTFLMFDAMNITTTMAVI
jgi:hypothetical protein